MGITLFMSFDSKEFNLQEAKKQCEYTDASIKEARGHIQFLIPIIIALNALLFKDILDLKLTTQLFCAG